MPKLPILKPREVVSILSHLGFVEVRQRGSHKQFRHADGRDIRLTADEFLKLI